MLDGRHSHAGPGHGLSNPARPVTGRLPDADHLLLDGAHDRFRRPTQSALVNGLLPVRTLDAGLDHRPGIRLGKPRRHGDPGHGRQRRPDRHGDAALLPHRRGAGHGLPRPGDDAVLLRLEGAQRARVHAAPLRQGRTPGELHLVRRFECADRRHQPVRHGTDHRGDAGLARMAGRGDLGAVRTGLHRAGRAVVGHLQRGDAVLRDHRRPGAADHRRYASRRRVGQTPPAASS